MAHRDQLASMPLVHAEEVTSSKAAYSPSPACQADSRNQRASSTVQARRFRRLDSRRLEGLRPRPAFRRGSMPSRSRRPDWPALAAVTMRLISRLEIQWRPS